MGRRADNRQQWADDVAQVRQIGPGFVAAFDQMGIAIGLLVKMIEMSSTLADMNPVLAPGLWPKPVDRALVWCYVEACARRYGDEVGQ